jgi:hypothetical protein
MPEHPNFATFATQQQLSTDAVTQSVRLYLADAFAHPDPRELERELADVADLAHRAADDPVLLESVSLYVLTVAWADPGRRADVARAAGGSTTTLPGVDPYLVALLCLCALRLLTAGAELHTRTTVRQPDGSLRDVQVDAVGPLAVFLSALRGRTPPPAIEQQRVDAQPSPTTRTALAVDVHRSGFVPGYERGRRREWVFRALRDAVHALHVESADVHHLDRGDGARLLIRESAAPLTAVVDGVTDELGTRLREAARTTRPAERLVVRLAVHSGLVHDTDDGPDGDALLHLARLVDAEPVKRMIADREGTTLAVVLSDRVFDEVVRPGYTRLAVEDFERITVDLRRGPDPDPVDAWVHLR